MKVTQNEFGSEEILFEMFSVSWDRNMPTKLFTFKDNTQSLHIQTGDHYEKSFKQAEKILKKRGLKATKFLLMGPSGIYTKVEKIKKTKKIIRNKKKNVPRRTNKK